jgi:hypothetical protein
MCKPLLVLRESHERGDDFREVSDKAAVEVAETNKGLHISQTPRGRPVRKTIEMRILCVRDEVPWYYHR